ncbi:MAG: hypothetical protein HQL30_08505, partial [Candidatus Omnitrophica bacterium]|nr:hypothetical protein [Candidatus Omnitrophota bacterium]
MRIIKINKTITIILLTAFLFENVVAADIPARRQSVGETTLGVPSGFNSMIDPSEDHKFLLKTQFAVSGAYHKGIGNITSNLFLRTPGNIGVELRFGEKYTTSDGRLAVPCVLGYAPYYWGYIAKVDLSTGEIDFTANRLSSGGKEAIYREQRAHGIRERAGVAINEMVGGVREAGTGSENVEKFLRRVSAAMEKADALAGGAIKGFQDEAGFKAKARKALSRDSFRVLADMYAEVSMKYPGLLEAIMGFMDIAKLDGFKTSSAYACLNFANHPEAGARILEDKNLFEKIGLTPEEADIALAVVRTHGFMGQNKRGEVLDEIFGPVLRCAVETKDPAILKLYLLVNVIDTAAVSEGLFDQDLFDWFYAKYGYLTEIADPARKAKRKIDDVHQSGIERLKGVRPSATREELALAVDQVFEGCPGEKNEFFDLLTRPVDSFSFWYPELALSWLEPMDGQIKLLYMTMKIMDRVSRKGSGPVDINFFGLAREVTRKDESRLREENREYIRKVIVSLTVKAIRDMGDFDKEIKEGYEGIKFEVDGTNNAMYVSMDIFKPIGISEEDVREGIESIDSKISGINDRDPVDYI